MRRSTTGWLVALGRIALAAAAALATVAALGALVLVAGCSNSDEPFGVEDAGTEQAATYSFTIPPGAGKALDRGEPLEVLPGELDVRVGEVIELVNDDDRGHLVGPFYVGAHETLRQTFTQPGEFIGTCTVHPSGELVLEVRA